MRKFTYKFDGIEVTISVLSESDQVLVEGKFPTPLTVENFFERDLNLNLANANLPLLTADEIELCRKIIRENVKN